MFDADRDVLKQVEQFGFPSEYIESCLYKNEVNHVTATYFLFAGAKDAY
jgi:hypothetical protein